MILLERPDGIRLLRVTRPEEAIAYRASFAGAFQTIFADPPYRERYFPSEAQAAFQRYLQTPGNITVLAIKGRAQVVGFGVAVPASTRPDIARELHGLLPVHHTFYLAELGVLASHRNVGLGRQLTELRLQHIDRQRFTHAVLRCSAVKNSSYKMYLSMDFDDMGVFMEVSSRRLDGRVATDRRLFLHKVIAGRDEDTSDPLSWGTSAAIL